MPLHCLGTSAPPRRGSPAPHSATRKATLARTGEVASSAKRTRSDVAYGRMPPRAEPFMAGTGSDETTRISWKQACDSSTGRARLSRNVAAGLVGSAVAAGALVPMQIPGLPRTPRRFRVSSNSTVCSDAIAIIALSCRSSGGRESRDLARELHS